MTAEQYAEKHSITPVLIPVMKRLHIKELFYLHYVVAIEGMVVVRTGYYEGFGCHSERRSISRNLIAACELEGFTAIKYYEKNKNSAVNERVRITIVPTSVKQFNNQ